MELHISENIYILRKKKGITQEQLAAALGVTFAAVSKWERGISVPELKYIAAMADFFGVSMDVLSGYRVQNDQAEVLDDKIRTLTQKKEYDDAITEAEKAVLRFPNHFNIVYHGANVFALCGLERGNRQMLLKGIELFSQAIVLLADNSDPEVNEATIRVRIAECYLSLGEKKTGLEILEKYNAGGMNNSIIGMNYALDGEQYEKAVPFLNDAFAQAVSNMIHITTGYLNYYDHTDELEKQLETLEFAIDFLQLTKAPQCKAITYGDKLISSYLGVSAVLLEKLGKQAEAKEKLKEAVSLAKAFDRHPAYMGTGFRFIFGTSSTYVAYDDIGESALGIIEKQLKQEQASQELMDCFAKLGGAGNE